MSLYNSKAYYAREEERSFLEKSAERLAGPTPHQAPQRERASLASARSPPKSARCTSWRSKIRTDVNFGVPQLLLLLEPKVVWEHPQTSPSVLKGTGGSCCTESFLDGFHKAGRRVRPMVCMKAATGTSWGTYRS